MGLGADFLPSSSSPADRETRLLVSRRRFNQQEKTFVPDAFWTDPLFACSWKGSDGGAARGEDDE